MDIWDNSGERSGINVRKKHQIENILSISPNIFADNEYTF